MQEVKEDSLSVIVFNVGSDTFAVNVDHTEGVVDCPGISPLPGASEAVVGVTSVHGRITIVMDLSFGRRSPERGRLILMRGDGQLGLLADSVEGVMGLGPEDLNPGRGVSIRAVFEGVANFEYKNRIVSVIDVERLMEL